MDDLLDLLQSDDAPRSEGLIESHRTKWPLNLSVIGMADDSNTSMRVRIKRAMRNLEQQGVTVSGPVADPDKASSQAAAVFIARFDRSGRTSRLRVKLSVGALAGQVQAALIEQGLAAVVDLEGDVLCLPFAPDDETALLALELDAASCNPEHLHALAVWRAAGFCNKDAGTYMRMGLDPQALREWKAQGFSHTYQISGWCSHGFTPQQAKAWDAAGTDYYRARQWQAKGFTPEQAKAWMQPLGHLEAGVAQKLQKMGIDPQTACAWKELNGGTYGLPEFISEMRAESVDEKQAQQLASKGYHGAAPVRQALRQIKRSANPAQERRWADLGPSFLEESARQQWAEAGMDPEQIAEWQQAFGRGNIAVWEVQAMQRRDITPTDLATWTQDAPSLGERERWLGWREAGQDPALARAWAQANPVFADYEQARPWIEAGVSPEQGAGWQELGFELDEVLQWRDVHPRCEDPAFVEGLSDKHIEPEQAKAMLQAFEVN